MPLFDFLPRGTGKEQEGHEIDFNSVKDQGVFADKPR